MQKPVLHFISTNPEIDSALNKNLQLAMNLSVMLNYHNQMVTLEQLLTTIVGLSYKGDVRMNFKMENPDKVKNLV